MASARLLFQWLIDLVYPPRCALCGDLDVPLCAACRAEIDATPLDPHARRLAPLSGSATSGAHDGLLRDAIHKLKYDNARTLAEPLGDRLAELYHRSHWTVDMIVPVPLHTSRFQERGYNQSQLIGERMVRRVHHPCVPSALIRRRSTPSQVGRSRSERQLNMQDAFHADAALVAGRRILLIDDVQTSGATLQESARALLNVGAAAVYAMTVTAARL
ncbi:MAG: ComF family protein [Anaerolinea sp.]|nr:ComF family protein [Anaerolinea sp.]